MNQFEKEIDIIKTAFNNKNSDILIEYLTPSINEIIEAYKDVAPNVGEDDIKKSAWKHLWFAISSYEKKIPSMKKGNLEKFTFSQYFIWFARQGITEFLHEKQERHKNDK